MGGGHRRLSAAGTPGPGGKRMRRWRPPAFRYLFWPAWPAGGHAVFFHWFFGYIKPARATAGLTRCSSYPGPRRILDRFPLFRQLLAAARPLPDRLLLVQTYLGVNLLRVLSLSLIPSSRPSATSLQEPFVQLFTPGGTIISKDLFSRATSPPSSLFT